MNRRYNIGRIGISRVNLGEVLKTFEDSIRSGRYGYVCVTNSRTAHLANRDSRYCGIQNGSLLTVPDGTPLVWIAHNLGYHEVGKVSGKDLMDAVFSVSVEKGYSHYFFGSTPETIRTLGERVRQSHPGISIKGAVSPPFQPLEEFDIDALAAEVNRLRPTFFWCGLGAPKQERLIAMLQPKLDATFCLGVGLAFEYLAGSVSRAPLWMRNAGLEWVYRWAQQPKSISRAIAPFSWVLGMLAGSLLRRAVARDGRHPEQMSTRKPPQP